MLSRINHSFIRLISFQGLDSYNGAFDGIDTEVAKHIPGKYFNTNQ